MHLVGQVGTPFQPDSARKRSHNLHETYQLPSLQKTTPDDEQRRCPNNVEFYDNWYLMHLVGCFTRNTLQCMCGNNILSRHVTNCASKLHVPGYDSNVIVTVGF